MAKRLARVEIGEFYAIPLFLSEYIETQRFKKADLEGDDKFFAFCRIIDDSGVSIIIEVFKLVSKLPVTFENILNSGRLYDPIMINGLGIYKKRWKLLGKQESYDKEVDSGFSNIQFVYPALPGGTPRLRKSGQEREISFEESEQYESSRSWSAQHLETRIITSLKEKDGSF